MNVEAIVTRAASAAAATAAVLVAVLAFGRGGARCLEIQLPHPIGVHLATAAALQTISWTWAVRVLLEEIRAAATAASTAATGAAATAAAITAAASRSALY